MNLDHDLELRKRDTNERLDRIAKHVALIMEQDGISEGQAQLRVWNERRPGYEARIRRKQSGKLKGDWK